MLSNIKKNAGMLITVVVAAIVFQLSDSFFNGAKEQIGKFLALMVPFFWAFSVAYLLNPMMLFFEKKFKAKRMMSLFITYVIFLGLVTLFIMILSPLIV
ncbi:MAG: hypothetical protein ACRDA4_00480, partial [Filifactoraceae bacterium]